MLRILEEPSRTSPQNHNDTSVVSIEASTLDSKNMLMPIAEQYRRKAEECRKLAEHAGDEVEREALLRMAAQWERLALYKEERP